MGETPKHTPPYLTRHQGKTMRYYYTRWTFKDQPNDLDGKTFHSTWITELTPSQMIHDSANDNLDEFIIKQFPDEATMQAYWNSLPKPTVDQILGFKS